MEVERRLHKPGKSTGQTGDDDDVSSWGVVLPLFQSLVFSPSLTGALKATYSRFPHDQTAWQALLNGLRDYVIYRLKPAGRWPRDRNSRDRCEVGTSELSSS